MSNQKHRDKNKYLFYKKNKIINNQKYLESVNNNYYRQLM